MRTTYHMGPHALVLDRLRHHQPLTDDQVALGWPWDSETTRTLTDDLTRQGQIERSGSGWRCTIHVRQGRPGATPWHVQAGDGTEQVTDYLRIGDQLVRCTGRGRSITQASRRCTDLAVLVRSDPMGWLLKLSQGRA